MTRPQPVKCGHCLGRGKVNDDYRNRIDRCPTCGGTGQVVPAK